jgi:hypothetical protein
MTAENRKMTKKKIIKVNTIGFCKANINQLPSQTSSRRKYPIVGGERFLIAAIRDSLEQLTTHGGKLNPLLIT